MRNQFNFFEFKFGKNISLFQFRRTKNAKSAFRLNCFLFVDILFFRVRPNNRLFSSLSSNWQPWFKVCLSCFVLDFTKLATYSVLLFVLVASAVATVGSGAPSPPNDCLCPPILIHSECFFGASRNDKTTGNNEIRNNKFQT